MSSVLLWIIFKAGGGSCTLEVQNTKSGFTLRHRLAVSISRKDFPPRFYSQKTYPHEEYLANPTAFNEKHKKGPPGSPNLFDVTPEVCEELAKMEVPVEYIRKLGELDAEAFGQILDYDQTLDGKSDTELLADQARFWGAKVLHELKRDFSRQNKPHEPGAFGFTAANVSESPEYYSELVKGWSADYRGTHAYYTRRLGRPYTSIIGKGVPRRRG